MSIAFAMGYGVADTGVDFDFVTVEEARALLKDGKAMLVDSRDEGEHLLSRVQTSFNFAASIIMWDPDQLDRSFVPKVAAWVAAGKIVVIFSDVGITGQANRGHVSRCRHVAQYLHEMGVPAEGLRRLGGGLNEWKRSGLDGVLGDPRLYHAKELKPGEAGDDDGAPDVVTSPTVYRVVRGDVFKKAALDADKIIRLKRAPDSVLNTTGAVHVGPAGGRWAELDIAAGEKKGWVYVEGPGFGPSTRNQSLCYLVA